MRGILLAGALLALLSASSTAQAQTQPEPSGNNIRFSLRVATMVAQTLPEPNGNPLSVFEYQSGTYTTARGEVRSVILKLSLLPDPTSGKTKSGLFGYRAPRFATLVERTSAGLMQRLDSAVEFTVEKRQFIKISQLTTSPTIRYDINSEFVERVIDSGRVELYAYYPRAGNRYVMSSASPGIIHEIDLNRSFIWRYRGSTQFEIAEQVPTRGYNDAFERQMRTLFGERADILKYLDLHQVRRQDLPALVKAYNSGRPIRFE